MKTKPMTVYMLEGTWWSARETPQVLPYLQALENSGDKIKLAYSTIRNDDDIAYVVSKIKPNEHAFLYIACHGEEQSLYPVDEEEITNEELCNALKAKPGAIDFLHIGCCDMIKLKGTNARKESLKKYLDASGAIWVSGYATYVDWLPSTLLELALISELAIPYNDKRIRKKAPRLSRRGESFIEDYKQLAKSLKFSGAYRNEKSGDFWMFPQRQSKK